MLSAIVSGIGEVGTQDTTGASGTVAHESGERSGLRGTLHYATSLTLVAVVALAVGGGLNALFLSILVACIVSTAATRKLFPEAAFFSVTFANLIAVYAAIFAFFIEEVFGRIGPGVSGLGFGIPLVAFLAGCWLWRTDIAVVIESPRLRDSQALLKAMTWLLPVSAVGAAVLFLSLYAESVINSEAAFLAAMLLIGTIVLMVSRTVAIFLVDAALLFEEFFRRMSRLAIPAFAFLTFYALLVIAFASVYSILAQYSPDPHFRVSGILRKIGFSEAVHFSIVTISTVGYGDIVPVSNLARALASLQVICGVMLLLFGVSELLEYTREHRHDRPRHSHKEPPAPVHKPRSLPVAEDVGIGVPRGVTEKRKSEHDT